MANPEDINRARKGKEVWNAWAEKQPCAEKQLRNKPWGQRAKVDFSGASILDIDFSGFIFPGDANFEGAMFGDVAEFEGATFNGEVNFESATFESSADFQGATFKNWTNFKNVKFEGMVFFKDATFKSRAYFEGVMFKKTARFEGVTFEDLAYFEGTTFEGWATFNNATFKDQTIFTGAYFEKAPRFHKADIHQDTVFSFGEAFSKQFPDIESDYAERAYCTLKRAMNKYQAHTEEAGFFKLELMARAKKEPGSRRWMYKAYGLLSDYGHSVSRPFWGWAVLALAVFALYVLILGNPGEVFTVTLAQVLPLNGVKLPLIGVKLPLIGVEKEALKEAMTVLFPPDGNAPVWFQISRALHMAANSVLIYLMFLALYNRFKIK